MDGTTRVIFDPVRRSDSGVYRVEVVNNFNLIPEDERRVERSFQITVKGQSGVSFNDRPKGHVRVNLNNRLPRILTSNRLYRVPR